MPQDWVSYDSVAQTYGRLVSKRLAGPAQKLAAQLVGRVPPMCVLDVGTGTGVATHALQRMLTPESMVFGVDVSREMLLEARRSGHFRLAVADATLLPFPGESFDVVMASFVMSHLLEPEAALRDILRVLCPGGRFAATAWAEQGLPSSLQSDWRSVASRYMPEELLDKAQAAVVPSEDRFGKSENLRGEFVRCGFSDVEVMAYADEYEVSLEDHIAERAAYSGARFMRATLPPDRWLEFLSEVGEYLSARHPHVLSLDNSFLLAIGRKP